MRQIFLLHLRQGSFTRKVRTIFTLKIIVSIFVKLFLILVIHLPQFFIVISFVKRATGVNFTNSRKSKITLTTNLKCSTNFTKYLTIKLTTNIGPKVKTAPSLT